MICAVATKTTGLKPEHHEVIEVAIKPLNDTAAYYRLRPEKPENYLAHVQEINGISLASAMAFPPKNEILAFIDNTWKDITVLGHNCLFDFTMLKATFGVDFVNRFYSNQFIDTMDLAMTYDTKRLVNGEKKLFKNYQLKHVCSVLGINIDHKCEALVKVYDALKDTSDS